MRTVWYMRGSVSLEEIYQVGPEDREIMSKLIKENLETTKDKGKYKSDFFYNETEELLDDK